MGSTPRGPANGVCVRRWGWRDSNLTIARSHTHPVLLSTLSIHWHLEAHFVPLASLADPYFEHRSFLSTAYDNELDRCTMKSGSVRFSVSQNQGDQATMRSFKAPQLSSTIGDRQIDRRTVLAAFVAAGVCLTIVGTSTNASGASSSTRTSKPRSGPTNRAASPLPPPSDLTPFLSPELKGEGVWRPAGRLVRGYEAIRTAFIRPLDTPTVVAGVAWMDTNLLSARLYSGSLSPGGLTWKFTAPISHSAAKNLVAAFNGGFLLKASNGGDFSEGQMVAPLLTGRASI